MRRSAFVALLLAMALVAAWPAAAEHPPAGCGEVVGTLQGRPLFDAGAGYAVWDGRACVPVVFPRTGIAYVGPGWGYRHTHVVVAAPHFFFGHGGHGGGGHFARGHGGHFTGGHGGGHFTGGHGGGHFTGGHGGGH